MPFEDYLRPDISKGITTFPGPPSVCFLRRVNYYLRPDISKGITTFGLNSKHWQIFHLIIYDLTYQKGLRLFSKLSFRDTWYSCIIYDLTYQKGLRLLRIIYRHKGIVNFANYLRPDISKGITTYFTAAPTSAAVASPELSTTWHIKRDYDFSIILSSRVSIAFSLSDYLRPDISKGITTPNDQLDSSSLYHQIIYDLTYQKGLRLPLLSREELTSVDADYLRPDISKGITTVVHARQAALVVEIELSTTWHIKRDYDFQLLGRELPGAGWKGDYLRPDISKGITTHHY